MKAKRKQRRVVLRAAGGAVLGAGGSLLGSTGAVAGRGVGIALRRATSSRRIAREGRLDLLHPSRMQSRLFERDIEQYGRHLTGRRAPKILATALRRAGVAGLAGTALFGGYATLRNLGQSLRERRR